MNKQSEFYHFLQFTVGKPELISGGSRPSDKGGGGSVWAKNKGGAPPPVCIEPLTPWFCVVLCGIVQSLNH